MRKQNQKYLKPIIIVGDVHLRGSSTRFRKDDLFSSQLNKLKWISKRAKEIDAQAVIFLGDLGDTWDWKISVINRVAEVFRAYPCKAYTILGNHDVPGRNPNLWKDTGLGILDSLGLITVIDQLSSRPCGYFRSLPYFPIENFAFFAFHSDSDETKNLLEGKYNNLDLSFSVNIKKVALIHAPIGNETTQFSTGYKDVTIKNFDYAFFGDIHDGWNPYKSDTGCILSNPGCLTRLTKKEINKKPMIAVLDSTGSINYEEVPHLKPEECFDIEKIDRDKSEIGKGFAAAFARKSIKDDIDPKEFVERVGTAAGYSKESIEKLRDEIK